MHICNRPLVTRNQKRRHASSSGGHKHGIKARWGEVTCAEHGVQMAGAPWKLKQVKTNVPFTKRDQQQAGCPQCAQDKRNKKKI